MHIRFVCENCDTLHPLEDLFYCPVCEKYLCSSTYCTSKEVSYYYCPVCFEKYLNCNSRYQCPKCYNCPKCKAQLIAKAKGDSAEGTPKTVSWYCFSCNWDSSQCQLEANSINELKDQTFQLLSKTESSNQQQLRLAAECIQQQLGLHIPINSSYIPPLTVKPTKLEASPGQFQERIQYTSKTQLLEPCSLRAKCTVKCRSCLQRNHTSVLLKPQDNPLHKESSKLMNGFRAGSFAVMTIPSISLYSMDKDYLYLSFSNMSNETMSSDKGMIYVTIMNPWQCSFVIPNMDSTTCDSVKLSELNRNKNCVFLTEMCSTVIKVRRPVEATFEMTFSFYYTSAKSEQTHSIRCTIDL